MALDVERFQMLCLQGHPADGGIGTLREKSLHRILKLYVEPVPALREQPFGGFVADILHPDEVIEIQTRSYFSLRKKLELLLPLRPVRVVCPLAAAKWIIWVDPETGALSPRRRSPKQGGYLDAFYELIHIAPLLGHPGLTVHFLLLDVEEYRLPGKGGRRSGRGIRREELIPLSLAGEWVAHSAADYAALLPPALKDPFTAADLHRISGRSETLCRRAIYTLTQAGALRRTGKQGRAFLYERIPDQRPSSASCEGGADVIPLKGNQRSKSRSAMPAAKQEGSG